MPTRIRPGPARAVLLATGELTPFSEFLPLPPSLLYTSARGKGRTRVLEMPGREAVLFLKKRLFSFYKKLFAEARCLVYWRHF